MRDTISVGVSMDNIICSNDEIPCGRWPSSCFQESNRWPIGLLDCFASLSIICANSELIDFCKQVVCVMRDSVLGRGVVVSHW